MCVDVCVWMCADVHIWTTVVVLKTHVTMLADTLLALQIASASRAPRLIQRRPSGDPKDHIHDTIFTFRSYPSRKRERAERSSRSAGRGEGFTFLQNHRELMVIDVVLSGHLSPLHNGVSRHFYQLVQHGYTATIPLSGN